MTLRELVRKRDLTLLGINSGTSADGIDLAVLRFRSDSPPRFLAGKTEPYPAEIRRLVLEAADSPDFPPTSLIQLDNLLGQLYGRAALRFIKGLARKKIAVDAVASHGQTVRHLPQVSRLAGYRVHGTLQLGSLDQIAALTGKVVVGDFRQADIALGNEGAPITVAAIARLFGSPRESRLILNFGGMANFFYLPARGRGRIQAADTGPGNVLLDLLAERLLGQRYDRNGKEARSGTLSHPLLSHLETDALREHRTVSTGRERYGAALCESLIGHAARLNISRSDLFATAMEFSVDGVRRQIEPILRRDRSIRKLYLTGGGSHNSFLKTRLQAALPQISIGTVSELGMDPDLVEAASYAVMGRTCLRSEPLETRFAGPARQQLRPVLGRIAQPPRTA